MRLKCGLISRTLLYPSSLKHIPAVTIIAYAHMSHFISFSQAAQVIVGIILVLLLMPAVPNKYWAEVRGGSELLTEVHLQMSVLSFACPGLLQYFGWKSETFKAAMEEQTQ